MKPLIMQQSDLSLHLLIQCYVSFAERGTLIPNEERPAEAVL
jgi:hypothetical protein